MEDEKKMSVPLVQPERLTTTILPPTENTPSFLIDAKNKSYRHQYANIYFTRLVVLRRAVEDRAMKRWKGVDGNPVYIRRVLDVIKSQLCWVVGTVYMEMPLKPNVLQDIGRDHSIPAPPPPAKFFSDDDNIMLEDESGRIKLVGERLKEARLVTGVIIAALGIETPNGEFEIADICAAGLAPFAEDEEKAEPEDSMVVEESGDSLTGEDEHIAVISGLSIGAASPADAQIQMLVEFLTGELGGPHDQKLAASVSRLIIAGNSLTPVMLDEDEDAKKNRRFGATAQAAFSPHPTLVLSAHLQDLACNLPIHILPGSNDPAGAILPQQPFPRAMFGSAAGWESFHCETNPVWLRVKSGDLPISTSTGGDKPSSFRSRSVITRSLLVNSGQPLLDMYKYFPTPPADFVSIAASTLKWRHLAPTAPDTLWCHPYRDHDPFVLRQTPDIYIVGGVPEFATGVVESEADTEGKPTNSKRRCRIVLVPSFSETGRLVLVNMRTLGVRCVNFGVEGMTTGGKEPEEGDAQGMQGG